MCWLWKSGGRTNGRGCTLHSLYLVLQLPSGHHLCSEYEFPKAVRAAHFSYFSSSLCHDRECYAKKIQLAGLLPTSVSHYGGLTGLLVERGEIVTNATAKLQRGCLLHQSCWGWPETSQWLSGPKVRSPSPISFDRVTQRGGERRIQFWFWSLISALWTLISDLCSRFLVCLSHSKFWLDAKC